MVSRFIAADAGAEARDLPAYAFMIQPTQNLTNLLGRGEPE